MEIREIIYNIPSLLFCAVLVWGTFKISKDFAAEEKK